MKYFFAIFLPPVAVFGCGKVLPGILNAILTAVSGIFLLSGFALSLTPLVESSGSLLLPAAVLLWFAACAHALRIVYLHSAETCMREEQLQLKQQIELMRQAAAKQSLARQAGEQSGDVPPSAPHPLGAPQS